MRVLYAGDSPVGGPANYLLGVLRSMHAETTHVPPSKPLPPAAFEKKYDVMLLSDYSSKQCPPAVQTLISDAVEKGMGFAMIGGWGSFSGPFGGWKGSLIEKLLPVKCLGRDDRTNFPGGGAFIVKKRHKILGDFSERDLPVICGFNHVIPRPESEVILSVRKILHGKKLALEPREYPLLVVNAHPKKRTAAFVTDVAPHWCGGMVDWGRKTLRLPVAGKIHIEVGDAYVNFISSIVLWLARRNP